MSIDMEHYAEHLQGRLARLDEWRKHNPLYLWRERYDLSMRQAAPLIGTNFNSIQDWEQGQYLPKEESYEKIARAMQVRPGDLIQAWETWWETRP